MATIKQGRKYSILPASTILEIYQIAKEKGDNTVILDEIYQQYLISEYKNDEIAQNLALLKSGVEPYLHYTPDQVKNVFGTREAKKKMIFHDWWSMQQIIKQTTKILKDQFNKWFDETYPVSDEPEHPDNNGTRGNETAEGAE